jgi:hypothetical protein
LTIEVSHAHARDIVLVTLRLLAPNAIATGHDGCLQAVYAPMLWHITDPLNF